MSQTRAIFCAFSAFLIWVLVDAVIKLASETALSPFMIMGILGLSGSLGVLATGMIKRDLRVLRPQRPALHVLICTCSFALNYTCVVALKHLPLTVYYIIAFTGPLFIAASVSLLKHEVLTKTKVSCLWIGFLGVLVAIGPREGLSGEWVGYLAAFVAVACFTVYSLTIRILSKTDTAQSIQFYSNTVNGSMGLLLAGFSSQTAPTFKIVSFIALAGAINLIGNILYNYALKHTSSTNVAQTHYTQIVSGATLGFLIWHEVPTWNLIVGSVVVVGAGLVVVRQVRDSEAR